MLFGFVDRTSTDKPSAAEAVADTALITAAGALWSALASSAYPGALA